VDRNTGDVFLFWDDSRDYPPPDGGVEIYCAKFDAQGNKLWGDLRVTYIGFDGGSLHNVVVDSAGSAHAIRNKAEGQGATIGYTKVLADGTLVTAYKSILLPVVFGALRPRLAIDASDDLHVVWTHQEATAVDPIFVQYMKLDNDGNPIQGPIRLSPDDCGDADLAVDSQGRVHVVWMQFIGYLPPWISNVFYCRLDNNGTMVLAPRQVNLDTSTGFESSILLDHDEQPHVFWYQRSKLVNPSPWSIWTIASMRHLRLDGRCQPLGPERMLFLRRGALNGWMRTETDGFGDLLVLNPYYDIFAHQNTLDLLRTLPQERCREGSVRLGAGAGAQNVLFVNGSVGNGYREMEVAQGAPIVATLAAPAEEPGGARYVIHATLGLPDENTTTLLPKRIGLACFDLQVPPFGTASPAAVWNAGLPASRVGGSRYFDGTPIPSPPRAPACFLNLPTGDPANLPAGTTITLQGLIQDRRSRSRQPVSVTNAVVVKIVE